MPESAGIVKSRSIVVKQKMISGGEGVREADLGAVPGTPRLPRRVKYPLGDLLPVRQEPFEPHVGQRVF